MKRERFLCRAIRGGRVLYSAERYALHAEDALADFRAALARSEHAGASVCVDLLERIDAPRDAGAERLTVYCAECGAAHRLYHSTIGAEPFRYHCHACAVKRWGAERVENAHAYRCAHGARHRDCERCTCAHGAPIAQAFAGACRYCAERRALWIAGGACPDARHAAEIESLKGAK